MHGIADPVERVELVSVHKSCFDDFFTRGRVFIFLQFNQVGYENGRYALKQALSNGLYTNDAAIDFAFFRKFTQDSMAW